MQVAVDGPAGSGKSSVCKIVAKKYSLTYLDTGAMYRAAAWYELNFGADNLSSKVKDIDFLFSDNGKALTLMIDGESHDVTSAIRTKEVSANVSRVSADPTLRRVLTLKQQQYAKDNDVIMEGRDITTVVLPDADIKIFLTASAESRAKRRFDEMQGRSDISFEEVLRSIVSRDEADSGRAVAPLKRLDSATYIDTTLMTLEEVAGAIGSLIAKRKELMA